MNVFSEENNNSTYCFLSESQINTTAASCDGFECFYGARCVDKLGLPHCACDFKCSPEDSRDPVCGLDGNTYGSECQMRLFSCRYQRSIGIRYYGMCRKDYAGKWQIKKITTILFTLQITFDFTHQPKGFQKVYSRYLLHCKMSMIVLLVLVFL